MNKLKQISIEESSFTANGKDYFIETGDLSIERWAKYEQLVLEMQYGVSQPQMFHKFKEIYDLNNELRFADVAVLTHNLQNGMVSVMERQPTALKICALFMNTKDEDRGIMTDDMITHKLNDWRTEGYAIGPFFQLALVFSKLISETSNILTPQSLELVLKQIELLNQKEIPLLTNQE